MGALICAVTTALVSPTVCEDHTQVARLTVNYVRLSGHDNPKLVDKKPSSIRS